MGGRRIGKLVWDLGMGSLVGLLCGAASALFLWLLERVIQLRVQHGWLLLLLPLLGVLSAWLYRRWGQSAEAGGSLVFDEVVAFQGRVPSRMAPLVLVATLLTHLGGGSAGREGTAVQMGASLARTLGKLPFRWLRLTRSRKRVLLMAGVAGGFGSLFGTPVAGALFGLEVIQVGAIQYEGLILCGVASLVGDWACRTLGATHTVFHVAPLALAGPVVLKLMLFALPVALVAGAFSETTQRLGRWTQKQWPNPLLRAFLGGFAVVGLVFLFRTSDYLNLGTQWLPALFEGAGSVPAWAFAAKFLFTVVTLGFGFKGGEVTPLFIIGAMLGTTCAAVLGLPPTALAAIGYVTLFAAASNTPLASLMLGLELFGGEFLVPLAITGTLAYVLAGPRGIYGMGRVVTPKR